MARNDIIVKLRLAGEDFSREFDAEFAGIERRAEERSRSAGLKSGGAFGAAFGAGLAALGTAIGVAISQSADLGAELASTSRQFKIGAEELQVWRFAAQSAGVSASDLDGSLGDLTRRIGEAKTGNRDAQQSFVDLGLSFETATGQARATDEVLLDLAERIAKIEDPAERVRLGTQLLGEEFDALYPLLLQGADGLAAARDELGEFGAMLSTEEIQKLNETNAKIEQMKTVLSIRVAGIVAENADAIILFTTKLAEFGVAALNAANDYMEFVGAINSFDREVAALPSGMLPTERDAAVNAIRDRTDRQERWRGFGNQMWMLPGAPEILGAAGGLFRPRVTNGSSPYTQFYQDELDLFMNGSATRTLTGNAVPRVTAGSTARRGGGRRRAASSGETAEERAATREAERAKRAEEQLAEAIERTTQRQRDSAEVQRIRKEFGELAAAGAEAELDFLRQHPLAVHQTVEQLALALGITRELTTEERERYQVYIDQYDALQKTAGRTAIKAESESIKREAKRQQDETARIADRQAEEFRRAHEAAVFDVADLYERAMRGGTDGFLDHLKDEGLRIIAEIAAEWTLAMIAGNSFDLNASAGNAFGRSPLSSIFFGSGPGGAANDNGGILGGIFGSIGGGKGHASSIAGANVHHILPGDMPDVTQAGGPGLQEIGLAFALTQAGNMLGSAITGRSSTTSRVGGQLGGAAGFAVGGPIGAAIGSALGNILGGMLSGTPRGSAIIGNNGGQLGITGFYGGSSSREQAAASSAGGLIDAIYRIAEQLGGGVDASRGRVSIGIRNDSIRVDPQGRGYTHTGRFADIRDFGSDEEAALEFALRDLIADGVLTGLSQVTQNLLSRPNTDLEAQIEKALMIEQVPKLLKQRLDPLGYALDELYDKFKTLADALREGGASAEQVAEAQRLYELEKAEAIASIGAASQTLKDFLDSLNAGSNSPLSLRQQYAEAEAQLAPYLDQIAAAEAARAEADRLRAEGADASAIEEAELAARTAAAAIDQSGYTEASQLLLSLSRQTNASTGSFFSDFDRIRALTGQAIGFVDSAASTTGDSRDPFGSAIAQNTADAAYILSDHTALLNQQNDLLERIERAVSGSGGGGRFVGEMRAFVR